MKPSETRHPLCRRHFSYFCRFGHVIGRQAQESVGTSSQLELTGTLTSCYTSPKFVTVQMGGRAISMEKLAASPSGPTSVNVTVGRRRRKYLTEREVERLIEAPSRTAPGIGTPRRSWAPTATASERRRWRRCDGKRLDLTTGRFHVRRVKGGICGKLPPGCSTGHLGRGDTEYPTCADAMRKPGRALCASGSAGYVSRQATAARMAADGAFYRQCSGGG
jgi:hypothetical protein